VDPYTATVLAVARALELWLYILQNTPPEILQERLTGAYEAEKWWRERFQKVEASSSALFEKWRLDSGSTR